MMRKSFRLWIPTIVCILIANVAAAQHNSMKAIVVHDYGAPEVLKLEDAPRPEPKPDEVLIRVMAAAVNPVDAYVRSGRFGGGNLPFTPGMDVAGVVEKPGVNAKKFKTGDPI